MWMVLAALKRPFVVWVGMLLTVLLGVVSYQKTPTDILPSMKVPVVVVFASYRGMPAPDMEQSVVAVLERALTRCDHLDHIESRSLLGIGIIKLVFRPVVDADLAAAQVVSLVNSEMQNLPPGMLTPAVFKYDASAVPVGQLVISSKNRDDDKRLLDLADFTLREELAGIEGLASAPVFGGVFRQVQIYVDPQALAAHGLSPIEVAQVVQKQSQVIPTGEMRIGPQTYYVSSNSLISTIQEFEKIPLFNRDRKVVELGAVARIVDGQRWRTNIVLADGRRAVYMPLLRQSGASAVRVIDQVRAFLPTLHQRGVLPDDVSVEIAFDQSQYVRDALDNVRYEAVAGAVLASLVVLLFLGSLRGTIIVALAIPLSVLAAIIGLYLTGHTLNIMTLGGIALVLGRVVDDCIVDVENTSRHLEMGKMRVQAVLDSAREISMPVLISTVTTVAVFFPVTFMEGVGKNLFTPLAVAAALAMAASYIVSRTVSPLCCALYLRSHAERETFPRWLWIVGLLLATIGLAAYSVQKIAPHLLDQVPMNLLPSVLTALKVAVGLGGFGAVLVVGAGLFHLAPRFDQWYERFADRYAAFLSLCLRRRWLVLLVLAVTGIPAAIWGTRLGQELFPEVDVSEFTIHARLAGGPRVETTEQQVRQMEQMIRGYQGSVRDLAWEILSAQQQHDSAYLQRVVADNPQLGQAFIDDVLAHADSIEAIEKVIANYPAEPTNVPGLIPPEDLAMMVSNIGVSSRWSAIYTPNNGPHAAFLRVQLRSGFAGRKITTQQYVKRIRARLSEKYPMHAFFFETGGMIRSILNAGATSPIEVQVAGRDTTARREVAAKLASRIREIPAVTDAYLPQGIDLPQIRVIVHRQKASQMGLTESDVVRNIITALMSSAQLAPNFWIDPTTGNPYYIGVQFDEYQITDLSSLDKIALTPERGGARKGTNPPTLRDVAELQREQGPVEMYHYRVQRVSQILVGVQGNDLAGVAREVERVVDEFRQSPEMPKGVQIEVRGEVASMRSSFSEMAFSLALAVGLVYLLMAAQFSSWRDPLIMIVAAPLGLIGVVCLLGLTGTSINIQSAMGVLMMVGISVSNSVLLVQFANEERLRGTPTLPAVLKAARVRLRPIVMTTIATVFGLLPLAVHLHPGDEMNLPLARAVIGGLLGSTLLTLLVVPVLYTLLKPAGPAEPTSLLIAPETNGAIG